MINTSEYIKINCTSLNGYAILKKTLIENSQTKEYPIYLKMFREEWDDNNLIIYARENNKNFEWKSFVEEIFKAICLNGAIPGQDFNIELWHNTGIKQNG